MDCARVRKLMPLALRPGDVRDATREAVLLHAGVCPACRVELEAYRRSAEALDSVREVPEPPGGWDALWAGIAERLSAAPTAVSRPRQAPRAAGWSRRLLRTAATLLLAFTAGFAAYHLVLRPDRPASRVPAGGLKSPDGVYAGPVTPVASATLPPACRERVGLVELLPQPGMGWQVRQVQPGSPAFLSGLRPDDVLKAVDDDILPLSPEAVKAIVQRKLDQPEIRVRVLRGGSEKEVVIKLHAGSPAGAPAGLIPEKSTGRESEKSPDPAPGTKP